MWRTEEVLFVRQGEKESVFLPLDQMPLLGEHNIGNVLSAALACLVFGTKLEQVRTGVKSFPGVPHRLEVVAEKQGVRYINDTTATIPEAAIAALRSFAEPVILIAGGSDKRLEFDEFAKAILAYSKGLILFKGAATEKILQALKKNLPEEDKEKQLAVVESMEKAVELASRNALPGDVVLLSPGATSFGIFKNEFDRGEQFRKAVNDL
jgi:UDP-N-acetylmuramoylalanine--D-glutamate ligase